MSVCRVYVHRQSRAIENLTTGCLNQDLQGLLSFDEQKLEIPASTLGLPLPKKLVATLPPITIRLLVAPFSHLSCYLAS